MSPPICRVLPFASADGPRNMAVDHWMLEAAGAGPGRALLRTYGWSVPTLSLGYFQAIAEAESDPRWADVPLVRRSTGGGAIWHHRELTYAVAIPASHPLAERPGALYEAVRWAFATLLEDRGVAAVSRGEPAGRDGESRPFLCFRDRSMNDVVAGGAKLVGSAQRRRAGGLLQQGSFLLAASPMTPELPGLADVAPPGKWPDRPEGWSSEVAARILRALELAPVPGSFPADDLLVPFESTYRDPAWTRRR